MLCSTPEKKTDCPIRRFPRVGSQYQTRILNRPSETSSRPAPVKMSSDFPYKSDNERIEQQIHLESNARVKSFTSKCDFHPNKPLLKTDRGGLLVYSPTKNNGDILSFVQPLITSLGNQVRPHITNEAWIQHMIHLHSTERTGKRNRASRGGVKRKREVKEELVWSLEKILEGLKGNSREINCNRMTGEDEAVVLQHLKQCHDGNIDAAKFNVLINFSGEKVTKKRNHEVKRRMKRRKNHSQHTSDSWRDMYELLTHPHSSSILGQLQDDAKTPYYINRCRISSPKFNNQWDEHNDMNVALESDDLKGAWRSILACGKSIERQLNGEINSERKPLLSTLLTFIGKASGLPPPETCFGTNHVMIEEVSTNMAFILDNVEKAQHVQAKIRDVLFDGSKEGIDSDQLLKFLDAECNDLPIRLEEVDKLYTFHQIVDDWESRLATMLPEIEEDYQNPDHENSLAIAENLRAESRGHGYKSKELFQLNNRIKKAYDLKDRILVWKRSGAAGRFSTIKTVSAFVKEAKRIKLFPPEVLEMFQFFRTAEKWIDRANIAIRSKISLDEIEVLVQRGHEMPLDLSEYIDKLETRMRIANDWLESLQNIIPFKSDTCDKLHTWQNLQESLRNGNHSGLHELSSEGNRIPVDLVSVKLLQLALDAKSWTMKAQKWIPQKIDSRKGKLCDLREHVEKLSLLRSKLPLSEGERERWKPVGEIELSSIIVAADFWLEKYKIYLEGDNRRNNERCCISIRRIRIIVFEGNAIHANIGNMMLKISRILVQAENWHSSYLQLLIRCGLSSNDDSVTIKSKSVVTIPEMSEAVEAAKSTISLELDEAVKLQDLLQRSINWQERVALIAPKRSKRHSRVNRSKFTIINLIKLIEDSTNLPIDTEEDVNRLQIQLSAVETWRTTVTKQLEDIILGFHHFKSHIDLVYGVAKDFRISETYDSDQSNETNRSKYTKDDDASEVESAVDVEANLVTVRGSNSALDVLRLVKEFNNEAKDISVITSEGETGELLDNVSNWFVKSFKYSNSPREIFDKRFFGAFDRLIIEGESLCDGSGGNTDLQKHSVNDLNKRLKEAWESALSDQLVRLNLLKVERTKFEEWCVLANQSLSDEKKLTAGKLDNLAQSSRNFPASRDMVSKIRGLSVKVSKWINETRELLESNEKIAMQDAKNQMETGEKLKVVIEELKQLKAKIRAARSWSNKATKCNLKQGSIHVSDVKKLIEEHEVLLIGFPDELDILKQATVGYCICRRPYDGFMIGCDHCEEWYHGPCIGISESKAGRFEKFICIRCSTKKTYHDSCSRAEGIIKKWTCDKDLKKARQIENQKLQRKERKERKDVDKFTKNIKDIEEKLTELEDREKTNQTNDDIADFEAIVPANIIFGRDSIENTKLTNQIDQSDDPSTNMVSVENGESATNTINDEGLLTCGENSSPDNFKNGSGNTLQQNVCCVNTVKDESTKNFLSSSEENIPEQETKAVTYLFMSKDELMIKLGRFKKILQQSRARLETVLIQSRERSKMEAMEDKYLIALKHWCLQVRSQVLIPSPAIQAEMSRPKFGVTLTPLMRQLIDEASDLAISDLSDVKTMIDLFKSICWCFSALSVLRRQPSLSQMQYLVLEASRFKLPDEKALRTMKFMVNRSSQCRSNLPKVFSSPAIGLQIDESSEVSPLDGVKNDEPSSGVSPPHIELKIDESNEIAPHAPDPLKLWPPFGLFDSKSECSIISINDAAQNTVSEPQNIPSSKLIFSSKSLNASPKSFQKIPHILANCTANNILEEKGTKSDNVPDCSRPSEFIVQNKPSHEQNVTDNNDQ